MEADRVRADDGVVMSKYTEASKQVYTDIGIEIVNQNTRWGRKCRKPLQWLAIIQKQVGQLSAACLDYR